MVEDGYEFFAQRKLITVFSAPNYCGEFDNAGALMSINEDLLCSFQVSVLVCCHNISVFIVLYSKDHNRPFILENIDFAVKKTV